MPLLRVSQWGLHAGPDEARQARGLRVRVYAGVRTKPGGVRPLFSQADCTGSHAAVRAGTEALRDTGSGICRQALRALAAGSNWGIPARWKLSISTP